VPRPRLRPTLSPPETSVLDPPSGGVIHLQGDFPGGVADLEYAFVLDGDLVSELRIR